MLDLRLALDQLVERAIPLLQLPPRHAHARCPAGLAFRFVTPRRDPTPAMTITDKVGLQPLRQRMLATGARQAIGNQHQCPLAERDAIAASAPASLRHHMIKTELIPELTYRQDRPPIPRPNGGNARAAHGSISPRIAVQQTGKLVEIKMPRQQIPAAEIDDRVVTGLAAGVAIGFDHAYVFAFDALADGRSDQAQKHGPIAGTSGRTCPCESTQDYRDPQSYSAIHSTNTCPYKSANVRHSPKQLQSLPSANPLQSVKHGLGASARKAG